MAKTTFNFLPDLDRFLSTHRKGVTFTREFKECPSIKDAIESLGVPHTEVNAIFVNDRAVDFSYLLQDGDRITVYPYTTNDKNPSILSLQPSLSKHISFVLDVHLGKLASLLRMLGFDTLYRNDYDDPELAQISAAEKRILLTRDKGVLMRSIVSYGYYVRETNPEKQAIEVLGRFNLFDRLKPFHRCIRCNGRIEPVEKAAICDRLPPQVRQSIDDFHRCNNCQQLYWQGSHFQQMENAIAKLTSVAPIKKSEIKN
jgi:uncharacterized protein with PIN domain